MKLGIMQPYLFPYIGYFQLIQAVDTFLVYDDVNYIKQGWINRNRILMNGAPIYLTLALKEASSFKKICEIEVGDNHERLHKTIAQAYQKAPYFPSVFPLLQEILDQPETNLARFVTGSVRSIADFLGIATRIDVSSEKGLFTGIKNWERVLAICGAYRASEYINAIGGKELYAQETFAQKGIALHFLRSEKIEYPQLAGKFIPNLSIIDVLMHNSLDQVQGYLRRFNLE